MNLIRNKKIFAIMQRQVIFRICCSPPSKQTLVLKYESYVAAQNAETGFDHDRENYPDKDYLILLIATLSNGNDEIFHKTYFPSSTERRKNGIEKPTLSNNDGLMTNIPMHLRASKGERSLRMNYCTKEERQELKLHMADLKVKSVTEAKNRLQKDIDKDRAKEKKKLMKEESFDMTEMRKQLEVFYQE
jgi:hypothetical protein